jgi:hypothetical protein
MLIHGKDGNFSKERRKILTFFFSIGLAKAHFEGKRLILILLI